MHTKTKIELFHLFQIEKSSISYKKLNEWQVFALRKLVVFYTSNFGGKLQIVLGVSAKNTLGKKKMKKMCVKSM